MDCGISVVDIPLLGGNMLIQNNLTTSIFMTISAGICLDSRVLNIPLNISLMVLICLSTS